MRYFTVKQIREQLGLARDDSVLALIKGGQIKALNISRRPESRATWRISESAIAEFLERRTFVPTSKPKRRRKPWPAAEQVPDFFPDATPRKLCANRG
jgi:hypothetical protein